MSTRDVGIARSIYVPGMALEIRTITDDEIPQLRETLLTTFGADAEVDVGGADQHRKLVGPAQSWGAFDGGTNVATAATFDLQVGVPGGSSLAMAGLTMVTVRPSHRRRGILRELMRLHFEDARTREFPVSGLWASETPIYQKFGYGLAAFCDVYEIPNAHALDVAAGRELDELEWIDEARARGVLPGIYARATASRPGALRRSDVWWQERRFLETSWARAGASRRRTVLARRGADIVGYIVFRQRGKFTDGMPDGKIEIVELLATDPRAEATLWKFAVTIDLFPHVSWWNVPADDALPYLADDMRRLKRRRGDGLWLRIEDVPTTLAARSYNADGVVRMSVDNATYELVVTDGRGHCTATTKAGDILLDRRSLAALYLGGTSATQLARADLVRGDARAIATADRLFASTVAPWCPEVF